MVVVGMLADQVDPARRAEEVERTAAAKVVGEVRSTVWSCSC